MVSLLGELLKLDWRRRINAIDALKHPYFSTPPLPAKPGELPRFEDSHELDRRKFRGQKAAPPPAPAGGSVGLGTNGDWSFKSAHRPGPEYTNSRLPNNIRGGRPPNAHYPINRPLRDERSASQTRSRQDFRGTSPRFRSRDNDGYHSRSSGNQHSWNSDSSSKLDTRHQQRRGKSHPPRAGGHPDSGRDLYGQRQGHHRDAS